MAPTIVRVSNSTYQWDYSFCKTSSSCFLISTEARPLCQLRRLKIQTVPLIPLSPFLPNNDTHSMNFNHGLQLNAFKILSCWFGTCATSCNFSLISLYFSASQSLNLLLYPLLHLSSLSARAVSSLFKTPATLSRKSFPESVLKYFYIELNPVYCAATKTQKVILWEDTYIAT